jgi:hypothetical protein
MTTMLSMIRMMKMMGMMRIMIVATEKNANKKRIRGRNNVVAQNKNYNNTNVDMTEMVIKIILTTTRTVLKMTTMTTTCGDDGDSQVDAFRISFVVAAGAAVLLLSVLMLMLLFMLLSLLVSLLLLLFVYGTASIACSRGNS